MGYTRGQCQTAPFYCYVAWKCPSSPKIPHGLCRESVLSLSGNALEPHRLGIISTTCPWNSTMRITQYVTHSDLLSSLNDVRSTFYLSAFSARQEKGPIYHLVEGSCFQHWIWKHSINHRVKQSCWLLLLLFSANVVLHFYLGLWSVFHKYSGRT